ncbi:MAG: hypothetical protein IJS54_02815 [Desulfovibrio sp.]|nr:hypothetical protein [Desulfovibrio sp.]
MGMHDYAKQSKFAEKIRQMHNAEVNGSELYFVLAYLAKEKGLSDLADVLIQNACEDALHGGMYGAMLGKGHDADDAFWQQIVRLYRLEASANASLAQLAEEIRAGGEPALADCVAATIAEEDEHARRLEKVFVAHGIAYTKDKKEA